MSQTKTLPPGNHGVPDPSPPPFGLTDVGRKRDVNQDQFLIARLSKSLRVVGTSLPLPQQVYGRSHGTVLMVADGMGGHAGGEVASGMAIRSLVTSLLDTIHWHFHGRDEEDRFVESLQSILQNAHAEIRHQADRDASVAGMGTTVTMAYVIGRMMYVVHAGDSRCYLIRDGVASCITTDHTMARRLVQQGGLDPADEASSRWSNVLWNVLGGGEADLTAEVHRVELAAGDGVLLCSDGLHRYVDEARIAETYAAASDCQDACRRFVDLANDAGGADNITAVGMRFNEDTIRETTWIEEIDDLWKPVADR